MGKFIEQLKNLKTRGVATAKLTQPSGDAVLSVLSAEIPLVSKISHWQKRIVHSDSLPEYFAAMREFRATCPSESEICELYRVAGLKLMQLKQRSALVQSEIERRMTQQEQSPSTTPAALTKGQAQATRRKYKDDGELWTAFWIWAGKQLELGACAVVIEESEQRLHEACIAHETRRSKDE